MDMTVFHAASAAVGGPLTLAFVAVVVAIFLWSLVCVLTPLRASPRAEAFARYAPVALTSVGMLGTFVGIYIGLTHFDVRDVSGSMPGFLQGLKVAFASSITGMALAVVLRTLESTMVPRDGSAGASAEDIYRVLAEMHEQDRATAHQLLLAVERLRADLGGEGDNSTATLLQNLRMAVTHAAGTVADSSQAGFEHMAKEFRQLAGRIELDARAERGLARRSQGG
jgi:hypothetical protein